MVPPPIPRSAFTCIATRCCTACGGSRRSEGCGSKTQRRGSTCSSACASARFFPRPRLHRQQPARGGAPPSESDGGPPRTNTEAGDRRLVVRLCVPRTKQRSKSWGAVPVKPRRPLPTFVRSLLAHKKGGVLPPDRRVGG